MLDSVIAAVRGVARQEIIPRYLKVAHQRKSDGSLFTEADIAAQEVLGKVLKTIHPGPLVGEEMSQDEQSTRWLEGAGGLWCVDPIDGTSNFVNGLPYFAVSVALMRQGRPVLGVVYDPVADEVFYAEQGKGAYLNGEKLPIKDQVPTLRAAMASVDLKRLPAKLALELAAHPPYSSQRNFGASTLEWCYTAAGRFDLYLHGGQKLWDYAAGALILAEAGGSMCSLEKDEFWSGNLWKRSVIAALDPGLFQEWKTWIRERQ
ncbi:MAG: inositol monophosphatase family protein [Betaproteobacteria bacterium]|nr:inositol monophosphatase family protein [Betaproteobacteria bacterium]